MFFLIGSFVGGLALGIGAVELVYAMRRRASLRRKFEAMEAQYRRTGVEVDPYDPLGLIGGKWN